MLRFKLFLKVEGLRDEADKAKRECLGVKKIAEEKEVLFKQEQAALRKVRHNSCFCVGLHEVSCNPALSYEQKNGFVCLFVGLRELDAWPTHCLREEWE